jgi:metallo-beta-lactamase family protein
MIAGDFRPWFGALASSRPRVILTHGEDGPRQALAARIRDQFGLSSEMPAHREVIEF